MMTKSTALLAIVLIAVLTGSSLAQSSRTSRTRQRKHRVDSVSTWLGGKSDTVHLNKPVDTLNTPDVPKE